MTWWADGERKLLCTAIDLTTINSYSEEIRSTAALCSEKLNNHPQVQNVAIIADVCLLRDAVGPDDYWSIRDSRDAALYMVDSAKKRLTEKGYVINCAEAPFVGAFKNPAKTIKSASEKGGQVSEKSPPLFEVEGVAADPVYHQSLRALISQALQAVQQRKDSPSSICCSNSDMKKDLDIVSAKTGGDAILVLVGNGVIVPAVKSIAQGIATGCFTTALTLGMVTYSQWNVSWLDTYAILVDVQTGEVLWSNALRLKGNGFTEKDYYSEKWPYNILFHMPSKIVSKTN